ncbi:hypothetical protein [Chryseobacterium luteum]|uniref:Uncharacterized protein n=1 Tax=Chryseobacterium luteum TaxID=421531 RepID=A0A085Z3M5_9FLAO|nr:hypothetical protein [Chryseobacterium luteum]KFE99038.1 hypothetical protein IX38_18545 [Chryseobacterium luteum]
MKKKLLPLILLGSMLSLFSLQGCVHDALEREAETVQLQQNPLSYIRQEYVKDMDLIAGKQIEWENARTFKHNNNVILISVPVKNESEKLIEELTFRIDGGKISGHLWKFESIENFSSEDHRLGAHEIMKKMTGNVTYIAMEGSMRYQIRVVDGKIVSDISSKFSGDGDMDSCGKKCHGSIDEVVITVPNPPTNPQPPTGPPIPPFVIIPPTPNPNDPCTKAQQGSQKATDNSKTQKFSDAKQGILNNFNQNGKENGVGMGRDTPNGELKATGVQELNANSGDISNPYAYPEADIHNHPGNTPPSAGDVYSMIKYYNSHPSFNTRYIVTPNGTVYALIITNANLFESFITNVPPSQVPGFAPNFSGDMFADYVDISNRETGMAYVLDKYNSGIALTKMDANGNFKKINVKPNSNGSGYTQTPCP